MNPQTLNEWIAKHTKEHLDKLVYDLLHGKIIITYEGDNPRQQAKDILIFPSHGEFSVSSFTIEERKTK